jgi:hypothetical protein
MIWMIDRRKNREADVEKVDETKSKKKKIKKDSYG